MKIVQSAAPGWLLWRRGLCDPIARLLTDGELYRVLHPGTTEEVVHWVLTAPSELAREDCFLTPAGMVYPGKANSVALDVFLDIPAKHRAGLLDDKFGRAGRPKKTRIAARSPSIHAGVQGGEHGSA